MRKDSLRLLPFCKGTLIADMGKVIDFTSPLLSASLKCQALGAAGPTGRSRPDPELREDEAGDPTSRVLVRLRSESLMAAQQCGKDLGAEAAVDEAFWVQVTGHGAGGAVVEEVRRESDSEPNEAAECVRQAMLGVVLEDLEFEGRLELRVPVRV